MRWKGFRLDRSAIARLIAVLVVGGTLVMWGRAGLSHTDSVVLQSPKRSCLLESGYGEIRFRIAFRPGDGWGLKLDTAGVGGPPRWFRFFRWERRLLSLEIAAGYWVIVLLEGVVLYFLFFRRNRGRRRKPGSRRTKRKKVA